MDKLFDLSGKKAIVTGGGRGIGRDVAVGLARQGADVALWSRTKSELDETADLVRALGRQAWVQPVDGSDVAAVREATAQANAAMGRIDVLFNNAGVNVRQKPEDVTEENYDKIMGINLRGAFFTAQAVGRIMIAQKGGKIISTSSVSAKLGMPERIVYGSAKAAIDHMTKCLAMEWGQYNICVNAVAPAFVETPMTNNILSQESFKKMFAEQSLFPRLVRGDEVASMVVYLASNEADMVTGHTFYLDAGWTIH